MGVRDLLIVEDHPLFRSGLAHMADSLRPEWQLRFAGDAATALAAIENTVPDMAIVDVGLPDGDGFALLRTIVQRWPQLRVLMISARDTPQMASLAERRGAQGFIGKGEPPESIVSAVDTILAGGRTFPLIGGIATVPTLTQRQGEVLALLEQGCSNKEMRYRMGIAERTVRAHLTDIFALLKVHSRTQALIRARDLGLIH
ncbi:response regulator [uncultured Sphingomonas sp.]|uniref:response regulator n=1 Tax=uncultured Sphingomonas sp. TaxID=158754 RepID=UPI00374866FA